MARRPRLARLLLVTVPVLALAGCAGSAGPPAPEPLYGDLSATDAATADEAMQRALETLVSGTMTSWSDPDSYVVGSFMPLRTFRTTGGLYCRAFEETIAIKGAVDRYQLVGCRSPDGTWRPAVTPGDKGTTLAAGG
jgi:hypothetical protein